MSRMKTAALFFLVLVLPAAVGWLQQLPPAASAQESLYTLKNLRQYQVQYTHTLVNTSASVIARQDLWIPIPVGNLNQRVLNVAFNPQPTEFLEDNWGQHVAHYVVTNMAGGSTLDIGWTADVQLSYISFNVDPTVSLDDIPAEIITTYTADDVMFLITDPVVVAAAAAAVGSETTLYGKVESIFWYVIDHMSYSMEGGTDAAPTVLARGNGSCSEYAHATMALLRANGIPCRIVGGTRNRAGAYDNYTDTAFHRATEVFFPNHGWVPVDTGLGDTRGRPIFTRYNDYFVFHMSGGRSNLLHSNYTARIKVADTTEVTRTAQWTVREITLDRPPAVTTNDAIEVASSSATLNGKLTAMGSAASVAVSFEYGTAPAVYSGETAPESKTAAWSFSHSLEGLSPGVTYYYRAKAVGNGTVYGTEKSFTTGTTPPAVATVVATDLTTDSAWLNGDLTSMGTGNSAMVSFAWGTHLGVVSQRDRRPNHDRDGGLLLQTGQSDAGNHLLLQGQSGGPRHQLWCSEELRHGYRTSRGDDRRCRQHHHQLCPAERRSDFTGNGQRCCGVVCVEDKLRHTSQRDRRPGHEQRGGLLHRPGWPLPGHNVLLQGPSRGAW
jgi:transglutaminase-like putative cysteine protease